jgi:cytochrome oxidase Cu insertion factor (SCO1/SenC/PrrC family)
MINQMLMRTCGGPRAVALLAALTFSVMTERMGVAQRSAVEGGAAFETRPELDLGRSAEYDYDPPVPGTYELPALKPAGDGPVLNLSGQRNMLRKVLEGRITLLSFIYTRCADPTACPYATGVLYKVHAVSELDPILARNLRLVTFSFDPEHDTPQVLSSYTRALRKETGAEWLFLTTESSAELAPILQAFGQPVDRKKNPADPLGPYNHLLRVYLIDREGTIRNIYSSGMLDPRVVVTDVRTLLLEERAAGKNAE